MNNSVSAFMVFFLFLYLRVIPVFVPIFYIFYKKLKDFRNKNMKFRERPLHLYGSHVETIL